MVPGIATLKAALAGFEDCYTVIGGTAGDIIMSESGLDFRTTKDIDMVVIIESRFPQFAKTLWKYIKAGNYRYGRRGSSEAHFYRFTEPQQPGYPAMIELFSRKPDFLAEVIGQVIPLHAGDDISSLSALLLDDSYYRLLRVGRRTIEGISVLGAKYLIPFKAKAFLDLSERRARGEHVDGHDVKKHRNDVFRLAQLIVPEEKVMLPAAIYADMSRFIATVRGADIPLHRWGINSTVEGDLDMLESVYIAAGK